MSNLTNAPTDKVIAAYKGGTPEVKKVLEDIHGKDLFIFNDYKKINSVEDACKIMGYDYATLFSATILKNLFPYEIANRKLAIIAEAYNKLSDWKLNWLDTAQQKWYAWLNVIAKKDGVSGRGLSLRDVFCADTISSVGPRHYVGTKEEAKYMFLKFTSLFEEATFNI